MQSKHRTKILSKLIKEADFDKRAQAAIDSAQDAKDGEEFAHKVFLALVDSIKIEGLDD